MSHDNSASYCGHASFYDKHSMAGYRETSYSTRISPKESDIFSTKLSRARIVQNNAFSIGSFVHILMEGEINVISLVRSW